MRIVTTRIGDLTKIMDGELKAAARAVKGGVGDATMALRDELRARTRASGYDNAERLAKAWRAEVYPKGGKDSIRAAGLVWSNAENIHALMSQGGTLRAKGGFWRVIPLPAAIKKHWDTMTDKGLGRGNSSRWRRWANVDAAVRALGPLRFVSIGPGKALLVADNLTPGLRRSKTRRRKDGAEYSPISGRRVSAPLFLLVKVTRHAKKFDIPTAVAAASQRLVSRIIDHWQRAAA